MYFFYVLLIFIKQLCFVFYCLWGKNRGTLFHDRGKPRGLVCNWAAATSFDWQNYDIVAFNEIWGIKEFENLKVNGFEIKTKKLRENRRGGGSLIFCRENLTCTSLDSPFIEGCIETTAVKIGNILFVNVYRPPNGSKSEFVETLKEFLLDQRYEKIIIGGDFNVNLLADQAWYTNLCLEFNLEVKINEITRIASGTCIDNFLTNLKGSFSVSDICISDHQAIIAKLNLKVNRKVKPKHTFRQMKEQNFVMFNHLLYNLSVTGNDIESKWTNLQNDIKQIIEVSFPLKTTNKKYIFTMSQGLLKSRDKKNELLRKYKQGRVPKVTYINYNKIYRKLIKTEQSKVLGDKLIDAGSNGKKKWSIIKSHLLLENTRDDISSLVVDGVKITSKEDIAHAFKNHFETCAKKLAENLPVGQDTSSIMPTGAAWSFKQVTELDILKLIRTLKNKNSAGIDNLSNRMLKKEAFRFSVILKPLINESIEKNIFPSCLKTANIIPIFKKGDKEDLNNYRPIALLPVLSKVFEKVLNNQITVVIENGFVDDNQFGFRRGFSTEDAALKFVNQIQKDLNLKKHVVTVYVDVSKAFDSCDHGIIIKKLKRTGLDANGIKLMESYLLNRQQVVNVEGVCGGMFLVNIGVGQGTILGPTLFKIYIMDLHLHTTLFCVKFADDSSFEGSGRTRDEVESLMNAELIKIAEWFKNNRLTLHPNKSRFLVHSTDKLINLYLNGVEIMRCGYGLQEESVKLLGLYIDEKLDWLVHINSIIKKISKGTYLLWRHKSKLNINTKKTLYESFIRCHILYCLTVWGGAKSNHISRLVSVLKKSWRQIGPYHQHTLTRLKDLNILQLEDELAIQESKFIWRWNSNKIPNSLKPLLVEKVDNLRRRRFVISRNSPLNSIESRLSKRASSTITTIEKFKTKKTMSKNLKKSTITNKYAFVCRRAGCYICARRVV